MPAISTPPGTTRRLIVRRFVFNFIPCKFCSQRNKSQSPMASKYCHGVSAVPLSWYMLSV